MPQDRLKILIAKVNDWFPDRWDMGSHWYEIQAPEVLGDDQGGGIKLVVTRNDEAQVEVEFSNDDCYGEDSLNREEAEHRVLATFKGSIQ